MAFYDDLPGEEQAWWGSVFRDTYSGAAYGFGVYEIPPDLPVEEVGNLDLYGGDQEVQFAPFVSYSRAVIIYGKVELRYKPDPVLGYGTLYVGEIGAIEGGRIGCGTHRIPETERAGAVVVGGDRNHYLECLNRSRGTGESCAWGSGVHRRRPTDDITRTSSTPRGADCS